LIDNETSEARQTLRCVPAAGGTLAETWRCRTAAFCRGGKPVNAIIYLVGLVVIVMAILSFVGMR
jgi:hypothetical protein